MALDRWAEVAKTREEEIRAKVRRYVLERCRHADVVLFGSRSRGEHHALSDWDIAVITPAGNYAVEQEEFGQAVFLPLSALDELLASSMLILDIVHDRILLCGRGDNWDVLLKKARSYIHRRGLVKTNLGWFPINSST